MREYEITEITTLMSKKILGVITAEEQKKLNDWVLESQKNKTSYQEILSKEGFWEREELIGKIDHSAVKKALHRAVGGAKRARRRSLMQVGVAMAMLLVVVGGFIALTLFTTEQTNEHPQAAQQMAVVSDENNSDKIELTLDDGTKIVVDENQAFGKVGEGVDFVENADRTLVYNQNEQSREKQAEPVYNTLYVPRGKDYNIVLSDGSKIYLNAQSEVRYPVAFVGDQREVWIRGEAYFEVAQMDKPFKVHGDQVTVTVLGTSFNLMAYKDEPTVETTLVEGEVRLEFKGEGKNEIVLSPGKQATYNKEQGSVDVAFVNTAKYIAWKDRVFIFDYETTEQIMRKLSRWYDVDISVESEALGAVAFFGKLPKYENITTILDMMIKIHPFKYEIINNEIYLKTI